MGAGKPQLNNPILFLLENSVRFCFAEVGIGLPVNKVEDIV
jgi:hypothetical protein